MLPDYKHGSGEYDRHSGSLDFVQNTIKIRAVQTQSRSQRLFYYLRVHKTFPSFRRRQGSYNISPQTHPALPIMTPESTFLIKSSLFDRDRLLTVNPDYLSFDDNDLISASPSTIEKSNIESFRFGVDWIRGLYFIIGRTYRIEVRDHDSRVIKIRLRSLYGVRKEKLATKYKKIYAALHESYFNDLGLHYVKLVNDSLSFKLAGITITPTGIDDPKIGTLTWNSIDLKAYTKYFAICDRSDTKKYHILDYGIEWNAVLLYSVLTYILKQHQTCIQQEGHTT
jgi:hypothetical protein